MKECQDVSLLLGGWWIDEFKADKVLRMRVRIGEDTQLTWLSLGLPRNNGTLVAFISHCRYGYKVAEKPLHRVFAVGKRGVTWNDDILIAPYRESDPQMLFQVEFLYYIGQIICVDGFLSSSGNRRTVFAYLPRVLQGVKAVLSSRLRHTKSNKRELSILF